MFASRFAWLSVTPFGSPVEPEVYCTSAASLRAGSGVASGASASSSAVTMCRSDGASPPRTRSSGRIERDEHRRLAIPQDAGLAAQVVLDLARAGRRVHRHWNRAGEQHAEEAAEEIQARRQHQRDTLVRHDSAADEPAGDAGCVRRERGVAEPFRLACLLRVATVEQHVIAVRIASDLPLQCFDQVRRRVGPPFRPPGLRLLRVWRLCRRSTESDLLQRADQVAHRLGVAQHRLRQAHAKLALDAREELDPREAVEAEVAVERAVRLRAQAAAGMQLDEERIDQREQLVFGGHARHRAIRPVSTGCGSGSFRGSRAARRTRPGSRPHPRRSRHSPAAGSSADTAPRSSVAASASISTTLPRDALIRPSRQERRLSDVFITAIAVA